MSDTTSQNNSPEYKLVNAYDDTIRAMVRKLMSQTDMCQCEKCYLDVCALVFNQQYTHFVTTKQGELFTKLQDMNHGSQVEMTVVIMNAINTVKHSPKHA